MNLKRPKSKWDLEYKEVTMAYGPPTIEIVRYIGGQRRKGCALCEVLVNDGEAVIPFVSSAYRGKTNYGQVHATCFIKQNLDKLNLKEILALGGI